MTGFDGRCDAIFLGHDDTPPPNGAGEEARAWRRALRGLPENPIDGGEFDLIVVGGGVTGSAAALTAARLGSRVALIQNRAVLGGNASVEIGINPQGVRGPLVDELAQRDDTGDLRARDLLEAEANATVFVEHTVYDLVAEGNRIVSVDARDARSGRETRFRAPMFIDCTGTAILGLMSGARTLFGHESKSEYGEKLAPDDHIDEHHGHTVFFRTRTADTAVDFPDVPWAIEVAQDYANLNGQLVEPGKDNGPGPVAGPDKVPDPSIRRRMLFPASHFWEYGQKLDPYTEGENIRDHLLCAIIGTYANVRELEPENYANLELDWLGYVAGQGEFRRYLGDYVMTETDIRDHTEFPDAVVMNAGPFCLHYGGHDKYDFRLRDWRWVERDGQPYTVPFRCLYSADIDNLMMAGKHISVTHIAGSTTKLMGNGGQHAIATAAASVLCKKHGTTPRGVYESHLDELRELISEFTDNVPQPLAPKSPISTESEASA
ncbi:FAD-dependent oxidoreductase [Rhodococcus indonesiensis]